jgi:hypothetical protein
MTGMLLTPEHFLRQDAYIDASFEWLLRNCIPAMGLVGGGVRLESGQRGLAGFDPKIEVEDDGSTVRVTVLQARGVTPMGEPVDVGPPDQINAEFRKGDLAGASELLVYVVRTGEREEDPDSVGRDEANPDQAALRRTQYRVSLGADADTALKSLVVGQIRRVSETLGFELDGQFIPACATLIAHSALYAAWTRIQANVKLLAGQYAELHRTVSRYIDEIMPRGVNVRPELDILAFLERAVLALDTSAYEILDPTIIPHRFFQQIDRAGRRIALALDLSASTREYFQLVAGADASYNGLLEEERELLSERREVDQRQDLRAAVAQADQTLLRVRRVVEALEGKYIDFRLNRSIESLRFLLDRGGEHFYMAVTTPGHPQREGDVLTFVFSQLNLAGRHQYRIVLFGEAGVATQVGEELRADLWINGVAGTTRPISRSIRSELPTQRNFAFNFDTPQDVATISALHLTVQPGHRVRGAMLYQRKLGIVADPGAQNVVASAPPVRPAPEVQPAPGAPTPADGIKPPPVIKFKRPNT